MSGLTSLKVPFETRDRFAAAARARGMTVRALLDELSRRAADEALLDRVGDQMSRLRDADPDSWDEYVGEGDAWETGAVERLDA